jgi:ABC-type sugar transport system permease subunit
MRSLHANWFYVAVVSTGVVGVWGVVLALIKREPGRAFSIARAVAIAAMLIQVGLGVILWQQGYRPGNDFHVFYGIVIAFTLSFAYVYRATLARRPALGYGLLLLFVMGLGLRAWANVN